MQTNQDTLFPNAAPRNNDDSNSDEGSNGGVDGSQQALLRNHSEHVKKRIASGERTEAMKKINNIIKEPEQLDDGISEARKYAAVGVLFLINLLNYMDRFTVAGVLLQIQHFFSISNGSAGFIQTVFIISYMVVAPLFGYLGDRFNRKLVMLVGMLIWSGCTLAASFITDKDQFWLFLSLRGLVGIGEASYSTVAPTIIADLFVKSKRTRMLSVFFFAIPIGSGLGYIVGSGAAQGFGSWHWALRVTPGLGVITMILMMVVIPNPRRGASEIKERPVVLEVAEPKVTYLDDLKYILKNKSFILVTIAFTCMAFVVGSLTIWGPIYVAYSQVATGALAPCTDDSCEYGNVSFIFGLVTCLAGFLGVVIGAESAKYWKDKGRKDADALVCAIGLILAAPLLLMGFQFAEVNLPLSWSCIFFADTAMCLTWTLVGDMTMYVTMPSRRSTANAVQILTMHLFGDAGSPYLLGVLSDSLIANMDNSFYSKYIGLQRAMYVTLFAAILGGGFFLMAALFVVADKKKVDDKLAGKSPTESTTSDTNSTPLSTDAECGPLTYSRAEQDSPYPPINGAEGDTFLRRDSRAESENYDNYLSVSLPGPEQAAPRENEARFPAEKPIVVVVQEQREANPKRLTVEVGCDGEAGSGPNSSHSSISNGSDIALLVDGGESVV